MSFYAVAKGFCPAIYQSWDDTQKQVNGYSGALFKKFKNIEDAEKYMKDMGHTEIIEIPVRSQNLRAIDITVLSKNLVAIEKNLYRLRELIDSREKEEKEEKKENKEHKEQKEHKEKEEQEEKKEKEEQEEKKEKEEQSQEQSLIAFTDGSCKNNGKKSAIASYAVVWPYSQEHNFSAKLSKNEPQTNNRGEYHAVIKAIEIASIIDPTADRTLIVYTDSKLLINSLTIWITKWKMNNWNKSNDEPVANSDLLKRLDELMQTRHVQFEHVPAHTGKDDFKSYWNNIVDRMAQFE